MQATEPQTLRWALTARLLTFFFLQSHLLLLRCYRHIRSRQKKFK